MLRDCRVTNAVRCLPPKNKPTTAEIRQCNSYLFNEINGLPEQSCILALGEIAHKAVLQALSITLSAYRFSHNRRHDLPDGKVLLDSYHCSRYNTQTGRLTEEMFRQVFEQVSDILGVRA